MVSLASFEIGPAGLAAFALAFYVPVVAAPLVARGWRLTWASRSAALVLGFLVLAVLDDRGDLPVRLPEPGIMLVPVALGIAIAACSAVAGFERDIRGTRFGWRQPLGLLVSLSLLTGLFQGVVAAAGGRWSAPRLGFADYLAQLPAAEDPDAPGDYRVLFVGDPRVLPIPGRSISDGVAYALADDGPLRVDQLFRPAADDGDALVVEALRAAADESSARIGRLLAPMAIRFVVVPIDDLARSGQDEAVDPPAGLLDALRRQLDLRLIDSPGELAIFENESWLPLAAQLDDIASSASREAGASSVAAADVGSGVPLLVGERIDQGASAAVDAGTVQLSVPTESGWQVTLDGAELTTRSSFGWALGIDLPTAGTLEVNHRDGGRLGLLALQGLLLAAAVLVVGGSRVDRRARPVPVIAGELPLAEEGPPILDFAELTAHDAAESDDDGERFEDGEQFDDGERFEDGEQFDDGAPFDGGQAEDVEPTGAAEPIDEPDHRAGVDDDRFDDEIDLDGLPSLEELLAREPFLDLPPSGLDEGDDDRDGGR